MYVCRFLLRAGHAHFFQVVVCDVDSPLQCVLPTSVRECGSPAGNFFRVNGKAQLGILL